jgi:hypothetical protein
MIKKLEEHMYVGKIGESNSLSIHTATGSGRKTNMFSPPIPKSSGKPFVELVMSFKSQ